jgi:TatD DNase family protein
MQLVDTHCHIQSIGSSSGEENTRKLWAKADLNPDQVISRATEAGVTKLICIGCDAEDSKLAIEFVSKRDNLWATIGIHPHEAKTCVNTEDVNEFKGLVKESKVIAIGECGLDYFYTHSSKEDQIKVLEMQLDLATSHNLPLIFHVRDAFADFWPILNNFPNARGVLHSFTDNLTNLEEGLKRRLYIGVNGIATFAREQDQLDMYKQIPLESLLLETDAPFLTPVPFRGTINEPSMVGVIAKHMADQRGENLDTLAAATSANVHNLFGI